MGRGPFSTRETQGSFLEELAFEKVWEDSILSFFREKVLAEDEFPLFFSPPSPSLLLRATNPQALRAF